ncbi:mitochondrial large subunit ribosomal protein-domain-containing protein [Trametes elegans]|nr:mitochondrial large subunit ribosomal protein-domain-containing protein [Trametes elegans]
MLRSLVPRLFAPARSVRLYSTQPAVSAPAAGLSSETVPPPPARGSEGAVALPYRVPRNSNGSVPVYTDIRNGGTRYLVLIRNVQGSVDALAKDLKSSLFPPGSDEAARLKISTTHSRHVTLSGGRWKTHVLRWLASRGF